MNAITIILVAAFAIERIVAGVFFLLSYSAGLRPLLCGETSHHEAAHERAVKTRKLIQALLSGYLGIIVIAGILKIHLFQMMHFHLAGDQEPNAFLDMLITGMIVAGGAGPIAEGLKAFSDSIAEKETDRPVELTGKLILEQGSSSATDKATGASA